MKSEFIYAIIQPFNMAFTGPGTLDYLIIPYAMFTSYRECYNYGMWHISEHPQALQGLLVYRYPNNPPIGKVEKVYEDFGTLQEFLKAPLIKEDTQ